MPPQPDAKAVASKVNLDEIFPPGEGRDIVLNNCQNCHTFVPIVVLQMEEAAWTRNSIDHRERVTQLSDEEFKTLYTYLKANFHPGRPVPNLAQGTARHLDVVLDPGGFAPAARPHAFGTVKPVD